MKPKLYQYTACPFCCKVRALLHYKKISYEAIEVHPISKKEIDFSKDYRKVPIFIDEQGVQVNDSSKIMRHIERFHPEQQVFERDSERSSLETLWLIWADEKLVRALPPLIYATWPDAYRAFKYISEVGQFSPIQKIGIRLSGTIIMKLVAKKLAKKQMIENPQKHLGNLLNEWAKAIQGLEFLGINYPNGSDISIFGILSSIESLPGFKVIEANKKVYQWYCSVKQAIYSKKVKS